MVLSYTLVNIITKKQTTKTNKKHTKKAESILAFLYITKTVTAYFHLSQVFQCQAAGKVTVFLVAVRAVFFSISSFKPGVIVRMERRFNVNGEYSNFT